MAKTMSHFTPKIEFLVEQPEMEKQKSELPE